MEQQRLPIVDSDDGSWGAVLNQYIEKEHYNADADLDAATSENGGHKTVTIQPGTNVAGTAPLKFISGTLMDTPEAGAVEFLTDKLYFTQTTSTIRKVITTGDTTITGTARITVSATDPQSTFGTPTTGDLWIDIT